MTTVRELHSQAMRLAQQAMIARAESDLQKAICLAHDAYLLEAQAADLVPMTKESEPTRSILYRSAASLAYQAKEFDVALRLLSNGFLGYPPPDVQEELHELYQQITFERHLKVRGATLEADGVQLSLAGNAVGWGTVLYREFIQRIGRMNQIVDRTIQRMMGRVYQEGGRIAKLYKPFAPALEAPRASSFAITYRLVREPGDYQESLLVDPARVIDEVMTGVELVESGNEEALKERIHDEPYYRSFLSLTREMAPDGDRISLVGFTSARRAVALTRPRTAIPLVPKAEPTAVERERTPITVEGELDTAMNRAGIIILQAEHDRHKIRVEAGLEDLVRSFFGQWVKVSGSTDGDSIYLTDLQLVDD